MSRFHRDLVVNHNRGLDRQRGSSHGDCDGSWRRVHYHVWDHYQNALLPVHDDPQTGLLPPFSAPPLNQQTDANCCSDFQRNDYLNDFGDGRGCQPGGPTPSPCRFFAAFLLALGEGIGHNVMTQWTGTYMNSGLAMSLHIIIGYPE